MNKVLTKFKKIVDKSDEIVIIYGDCFDLERSGRDSGSANNSHYLNLTHPLCSLPPLSRCFIAANTIKSKVQRRTQYEPDRRVLCNRLPCNRLFAQITLTNKAPHRKSARSLKILSMQGFPLMSSQRIQG